MLSDECYNQTKGFVSVIYDLESVSEVRSQIMDVAKKQFCHDIRIYHSNVMSWNRY